ncbi:hypothetical protein PMAYCL1PPCAC_16096, partial [Pristionchus mayeri]
MIMLSNCKKLISAFAEIDENGLVNEFENVPWKITAEEVYDINCDQEQLLILKSDSLSIYQPLKNAEVCNGSGNFVVPKVGMWFNKHSASGEGNISVFSGAGNGEEEQRYLLQSWPQLGRFDMRMTAISLVAVLVHFMEVTDAAD